MTTELLAPKEFSHKLLKWWKKNKRDYPWRNTSNPYNILISEVLLHRTKADQVVPVYTQLIQRFDSIDKLANVSESELKNLLYPLGLHWRTKLFHKMVNEIVRNYNCNIPSETEELESLSGIDHYIASAVRCFAFDHPETLLDTNIVRILGRVFGVKVTDGSRRNKQFRELFRTIASEEKSREFAYAMIDLGALLCVHGDPICHLCPVSEMCILGISRVSKK